MNPYDASKLDFRVNIFWFLKTKGTVVVAIHLCNIITG